MQQQTQQNIQSLLQNNQKYLLAQKKFFHQVKPKINSFKGSGEFEKTSSEQSHNNCQVTVPLTLNKISTNSINNNYSECIIKSPTQNQHLKLRSIGHPLSARGSREDIFKEEIKHKVNLSQKKIKIINFSMLGVTWIQQLDLSWNQIEDYNECLSKLKQLKILYLQHNHLKGLPSSFASYHPELKQLNISSNCFTVLPRLQNLTQLYIAHNLIHIFPNALPQTLQILHIQGNPIQILGQIKDNLIELGLDWGKYVGWKDIIKGDNLQQVIQWLNSAKEKSFSSFALYITNGDFDFKKVDANGRTILHQAAVNEDFGTILGCKGMVDVNALDRNQMSALFLAVKEEKFMSIKYLLHIDCNPNSLCGQYGSILSIALVKQQFKLVQILLQKGADPNIADKDGNTPLHYLMAMWKDDNADIKQTAVMLLQKGACSNKRNIAGYAAFHMCIRKGYINAAKFVVEYKCRNNDSAGICNHNFDIDIRSNQNNKTPLKLAVHYNVSSIVDLLLQENVEFRDVYIKNKTCMVGKLLRKRRVEVYGSIIINKWCREQFNEQVVHRKIHEGYVGICLFSEGETDDQINQPKNEVTARRDQYFEQGSNMTLKNQICQMPPSSLDRMKNNGDMGIIEFSDSNVTNDSKNEFKKVLIINSSIVRDNFALNRYQPQKLQDQAHKRVQSMFSMWNNVIQYFQTMGLNYFNEFNKNGESVWIQLKCITVLIKMHIQLKSMYNVIKDEVGQDKSFMQSEYIVKLINQIYQLISNRMDTQIFQCKCFLLRVLIILEESMIQQEEPCNYKPPRFEKQKEQKQQQQIINPVLSNCASFNSDQGSMLSSAAVGEDDPILEQKQNKVILESMQEYLNNFLRMNKCGTSKKSDNLLIQFEQIQATRIPASVVPIRETHYSQEKRLKQQRMKLQKLINN